MIRFRPLPWLSLATATGLAILIGLGTWQLERREWKLDLIARVEARTAADPVDLPAAEDWPDLDIGAWDYRRVQAAGSFDHDAEAYVFTSLSEPRGARGGPGYWVVTPFELETGDVVLVNRGFVPEELRAPDTRSTGAVDGVQEVTGLIRRTEEPGLFTPAADVQGGIWFVRDVAAIAAARGLHDAAPFMIDAEASAPGGFPQGGETRLAFRNEHLGYAITWYGLAVALVVVYLAFHLSRGRLAFGGRR